MKQPILLVLYALMTIQTELSANDKAQGACPIVKIEAIRLPDLNIPRSGHSVFVINGEPTVVGGHTTSFVPTATAEFYRDGEWHLMQTAYPHDHGFSVPLSSGKVLIGGGHAEPLGIGHIYSVEMYDPAAHSFKGFGCLDIKRCFATGVEIDSGRVVVTGNWFQDNDAIELFDGQKYFHSIKPTTQKRSRPYVLRIADDDAIVFGRIDVRANLFDTIIVDRLKGEPFMVPLFNEWKPFSCLEENDSRSYLIMGEEQDSYTYLIPVENKEGQLAICRIDNTQFSLFPTNGPIPTTCKGRHVNYRHYLIIDQQAQRAYLYGTGDNDGRLYVLAIDMTQSPAGLTLFYTEPTTHPVYGWPVLMPDGNLLLTGGMECHSDSTVDNFSPHATVLLLPVGKQVGQQAGTKTLHHILLLLIITLLVVIGIVSLLFNKHHKKHKFLKNDTPQVPLQEAPVSNLMQRLCQLMDEQKPYLNSELKVQDIADMLHTNRTYINDSIKSASGQTFTQFVNTYRIEQAKRLLTQHPDKKMSAVYTESGFATESSFFRTFKAVTGITPNEWRTQKADDTVQN